MQVILVKDFSRKDRKGDIVEVEDTFAKKYIIPREIGVEATQENIKLYGKKENKNEER